MGKVKMSEATASQLADFATLNMGLPGLNFRTGTDKLRAAIIAAGHQDEYIAVSDDPEEVAPAQAGKLGVGQEQFPDAEKIKINIPATEGPGGDDPVWVAVNGRGMWIPRNQDCEIAKPYAEVLNHATKRIYLTDENSMIVGSRDVPQYPYQVVMN